MVVDVAVGASLMVSEVDSRAGLDVAVDVAKGAVGISVGVVVDVGVGGGTSSTTMDDAINRLGGWVMPATRTRDPTCRRPSILVSDLT